MKGHLFAEEINESGIVYCLEDLWFQMKEDYLVLMDNMQLVLSIANELINENIWMTFRPHFYELVEEWMDYGISVCYKPEGEQYWS